MLFNRGNAISGAPSNKGTNKIPLPGVESSNLITPDNVVPTIPAKPPKSK